jgi:hypothetical protein
MELRNTNGDIIVLDNRFDIQKIKNLLKENNHLEIDNYLSTIKGQPKHSQGGVDITISEKGVSLRRGGKDIKAAHGLLIAANGMIVKNVDKDSDYAEDGSLIPNEYKEIQDNTKINVNIRPLKSYKKQHVVDTRPIPILKADNRTEQQRKISEEYTDAVLNPSLTTQIGEGLQKPLRWLADPVKGVGDIISTIAPKSALAKELPNTNEDVFEYRKEQLNPYTSNNEKTGNAINEARDLTINSLINLGTTELGFALPKNLVTPNLNNLFKVGSKSNFAADLLQLSKTDFDKISEGDISEIGNIILNSVSLASKMDNFDASTIANNIKNWKTISKADRIDTYKDIFNISQSINQQTQRE